MKPSHVIPILCLFALPAMAGDDTAARKLAKDNNCFRCHAIDRQASVDFSLDLYAGAALARLLGTEETVPRYAVHLLGIGYP